MVDTLRQGFPIANRVEAGNMSDRRAAARLLGSLTPIFPTIKTVIADAGHQAHQSRELRVSHRQTGVSPTKVRKVPQDFCQQSGRKGFSANPELP